MSGKQNMVWNGEADAKLLLAILKVSDVKANFEVLAKELTTDEMHCTPRAVQEHLKKLRKIALGEAGPTTPSKSANTTTPGKAPRKTAAATPTGVKKTRKPATGGKGKKGKAVNFDDAEDIPAKMEFDTDDGDQPPVSKKREYTDTIDDAGNVDEEGSAIGSQAADLAQKDFNDELFAA